MKNYRLKPEAYPFFKSDLATRIYSLENWKSLQVDIVALEEVEAPYLTFGHQKERGTSLCGWSGPEGADFAFTIHFPSMKHREYDEFHKGKVIRKLMDRIQNEINRFAEDFNKE